MKPLGTMFHAGTLSRSGPALLNRSGPALLPLSNSLSTALTGSLAGTGRKFSATDLKAAKFGSPKFELGNKSSRNEFSHPISHAVGGLRYAGTVPSAKGPSAQGPSGPSLNIGVRRTFAEKPVSHLKEDRETPPKHFMAPESPIYKHPTSEIAEIESNEHLDEDARVALPHPIWSDKAARSVEQTHFKPKGILDRIALGGVRTLRSAYDIASGYAFGVHTEANWINRIIFLETIAGVPGLVGAMVRHLRSLRRLERDYGWIHTLLEEAENERMHLMTAMQLRQPGYFMRMGIIAGQFIFVPIYTIGYISSPTFCHRFVGYLEEEAVKTYTKLIEHLESGQLPGLQHKAAPPMACQYWQLKNNALFLDMIYSIRADESHHRDVNHTFANLRASDINPFEPGH